MIMNRKGFTLVELLAVIVILAILMVAAGAAVMSTLNNARVNTFKNEALSAISIADNMYTEISMNPVESRKYLKNNDGDASYKGMCVTLNGLVLNGYLNKELENGEGLRGVVLIEVPFNGGATKRSIWITNGTYALTGYEQGTINGLRFTNNNNKKLKNGETYIDYQSLSGSGVVTDIKTADSVIAYAHTGDKAGKPGSGTGFDPANSSNQTINLYSPAEGQGGTGKLYKDLVCINESLNK